MVLTASVRSLGYQAGSTERNIVAINARNAKSSSRRTCCPCPQAARASSTSSSHMNSIARNMLSGSVSGRWMSGSSGFRQHLERLNFGGISSSSNASWRSASTARSKLSASANARVLALSTDASNGATDKAARSQVLNEVLKDIDSRFGKGTIWKLGSSSTVAQVETTPSGVLPLDSAMGGGYPKGRIIEIYGPESSGKTTLALHAIAEVQKLGGTAALVDAEHAFEPMYAKRLGVNLDELLVSQPFSGEDALNIVDSLVRSMAVDVIAVDSVAALVPRAELEGEIGQVTIGAQARLMSAALRKLVSNASKCGCTVIFLNQLRSKVGVMYGSPEVTSGGNALKYYASVRIDVRRKETLKESGEEVGIKCKASIKKNKVAPPYKVAEFDILFGSGISQDGSVLDSALASGIAARRGAWYSYGDVKLGMGREKAIAFLQENPEVLSKLEAETREAVRRGTAAASFGTEASVEDSFLGDDEGEAAGDDPMMNTKP